QSGALQVGSAEVLNTLAKGVGLHHSGYLYIWVSNETENWDVFFDNLVVATYSGPMLEEDHYYPFGLAMAGISDKAIRSNYVENKYRWNKGSELQNKEFSDGSGLEMYETNLRELDPQLGRWWQVDPKTDETYESVSPYAAMNNDPVRYNDPNGDEGENCCELTFTWENAKNKLHQDWDHIKEFGHDFGLAALNSAGSTLNGYVNTKSFGSYSTNPAQDYFGVPTEINQSASVMGQLGGTAPIAGGGASPDLNFAMSDASAGPSGSTISPGVPTSTVFANQIDPNKEQPSEDVAKDAKALFKLWNKNRVTIPTEEGEMHYDLQGAAHKGVGTPHVQRSVANTGPDGTTWMNKDRQWVRPMTKADIKIIADFINKNRK